MTHFMTIPMTRVQRTLGLSGSSLHAPLRNLLSLAFLLSQTRSPNSAEAANFKKGNATNRSKSYGGIKDSRKHELMKDTGVTDASKIGPSGCSLGKIF